ncbi:hypothetical protein ACQJ5E_05555 [Helicobacter pylori]|uniref:hypothetical protein n=1 Tax=Helicobacter pylori TaxID=210 RepID=UPI00026A0948|nr:hypothetical protein [Helicobacter pylori]EJB48366.1 hypothetical protein HPHPA20_1140 [Helicobacter pylori Hp A-20]PDW27420.1 hypothetical protein BB455_02330 [Helicobacter pylori]PDW35028.1 hypothetical protein BB454_07970 [Helicobacter pylori]WQS62429.1 hypothetical protein KVE09_04310 [Helicobacter pylori]WQZ55563.1 hypothetical protein KVM69_04255 [Helicobacter pylori]
MPNTTNKDYTKYSQKQLFNLINQLEQKISQAFDDKRGCCLGHEIPNLETQQAMREALNGENLEVIEDFSAWANEIKKEVNAEN